MLLYLLKLTKAGIPALFLMAQVFFCPESPRWLMSKGRYADAFDSLKRLRRHPVQAARDLYCQSLFPLIAQSLTRHQTFTCSSRRRPSSLMDETAILSCSRSPVTVARVLPPSSSCLCEFGADAMGSGCLHLDQATILRRQRYCLLLFYDIQAGQLHRDTGSPCVLGLWCPEFRHGTSCRLYH